MAIIMQGKMNNVGSQGPVPNDYAGGIGLFWTGVTVGLGNLFCG